MQADIFIPTSNRIDALHACLNSLGNQTNSNFNIILIGKNSDSKIQKLISRFSNLSINYFIQTKPGLIGAANEALSISKSEIFIRLDDDVILDPQWYTNLLKTYKDPQVGGVTGPTILSPQGLQSRDLTTFIEKFKTSSNPLWKLIAKIYLEFLYEGKILKPSLFLPSGVFTLGSNYPSCLKLKKPIQVNNLEACNWSARTNLIKKVGGFDEIYLKGLGDYHEADIPFKISKLGYKLIFNPQAKLQHNVEVGTVSQARGKSYYRIQNLIIFYGRFFPIKSPKQLAQFATNLTLQNIYYIYTFLRTGRVDQLLSIPGTFTGLFKTYISRSTSNQTP